MSSTSDGDGQSNPRVNSQLASLVPSFDPSKDDLQTYQKRVQLVLAAWPKTRITLATRLILNCQGGAFDKLQLHQTELMENDEKSVQRIITLLGRHWGIRNPNLSEIHQHTQACQFDMCRAGDLRDPENKQHMKKGMVVLTTYPPLFNYLHVAKYDQHQHHPIEGSCKPRPNSPSILRSQYSETYTRKFARPVVKVLMAGGQQRPYNWSPGRLSFAHQDTILPVLPRRSKFEDHRSLPVPSLFNQ